MPRSPEHTGHASQLIPPLGQIVEEIDSFNRSWHALRALSNVTTVPSPVVEALRVRKSELQVRLLRTWPNRCRLIWASDSAEHDEPMLTVELNPAVHTPSGRIRRDANHLPMRVATELLTAAELQHLRQDDLTSPRTKEDDH